MRNGVIADTLRKAGSPYRIIFGLNLPQLREIADEFAGETDLADTLWHNTTTRESRMAALLMYQRQGVDDDRVERLIASTDDCEIADTLVMTLLRGRSDRRQLIDRLIRSDRSIERYMALRLAYSLVDDDTTRPYALQLAQQEAERRDALTMLLAQQLAYDADF